ncbi:MAG: M28 family peptidase [Theionarchaea archaeon]|nr:M28 family peptidase [Theionarchaea archaeon]
MNPVVLLSMLLGVILSAALLGYPPLYYVYLIHEILLITVFLWFICITFCKKNVRKPLESVTLFMLVLLTVLSPVNKMMAPDYESAFTDDPSVHTDYLVKEIGERPYMSENEKKASAYIENVLKEKGFSPVGDNNIVIKREGKKQDTLIVCAHYDTVASSRGADDNASGVSVLLGLDIPENPEYTLMLIFFTGEEVGLIESRYFADNIDRVIGVICVDTVGVGKDFHISSVKKNRSTSFFLSQVVYGLSDNGIPSIGPLYSDHVPFNEKRMRAVGLTRSTDRSYPHIHSELDIEIDKNKVVETGKTVQEIVIHFSYSENPYNFVYISVICAVIISCFLAYSFQNILNRIDLFKE